MRILAEIFGIILFLIGAYYGGSAIYRRWMVGPERQRKSRKDA